MISSKAGVSQTTIVRLSITEAFFIEINEIQTNGHNTKTIEDNENKLTTEGEINARQISRQVEKYCV